MPKPEGKSFAIPKRLVWEAWRQVKANKGAPGVDGQDLAERDVELVLLGGEPLVGNPGIISALKPADYEIIASPAGGWECHKVCVRQERMESHVFNTREEVLISASLS